MQHYTIIAFAVLLSLHTHAAHLVNALANQSISAAISGSNSKEIPQEMRAGGFDPKLQMELVNHTNQPLQLEMEEGYMMEPAEPGYQALLMTQPLLITLQPKGKSKQFIYAMCAQLSMSLPNAKIQYKIGKKAPDALLKMAQYIAKNKYQNSAAQRAVWSLSDNSPILSISSEKENVTANLQQFVANLKGVNLEQLKRENQNKSMAQVMYAFNSSKSDRNIIFKNDTASMVSVGYYSEQGELLKPIIETTQFIDGHHSIRYNPFPLSLTNKRYSVRMIKDGEVFKEYYFMQ